MTELKKLFIWVVKQTSQYTQSNASTSQCKPCCFFCFVLLGFGWGFFVCLFFCFVLFCFPSYLYIKFNVLERKKQKWQQVTSCRLVSQCHWSMLISVNNLCQNANTSQEIFAYQGCFYKVVNKPQKVTWFERCLIGCPGSCILLKVIHRIKTECHIRRILLHSHLFFQCFMTSSDQF